MLTRRGIESQKAYLWYPLSMAMAFDQKVLFGKIAIIALLGGMAWLFWARYFQIPQTPEVRGALLGASLAVIIPLIIQWWQKTNQELNGIRAIQDELVQIDQLCNAEKSIILEGIQTLGSGKDYFSLNSVRSPRIAFELYSHIAYPKITSEKRALLHAIYERMRIMDDEMISLESTFMTEVKEINLALPQSLAKHQVVVSKFRERLQELIPKLEITQELIQDYIRGDASQFTHKV
jgi:uncharacterized coiled-coil protein SlyX